MKVRHFSYDLHNGGAFIACDRLDRALRAEGADSAVFTAETIGSLLPAKNPRLEPIVDGAKSSLYANAVGDRTYVSNTLYSLCVDGAATFGAEGLGDPDILHFHWVTFLLNPISIASLAHLRLPLVWTLHDANPFTGGCHYPAGCDAFADGCPSCPQITKSEVGWPEFAVQAKTKALESFSKVVVTAPSNWLLRMARRSRVFAGCDFRVMKNCIPHHFHGRSRDEARAKVGLDPDDIAILFAAVDLAEKRKGFSLAIEAFRTVVLELEQSGQQSLVSRLRPLALGRASDHLKSQLGAIGLSVRDFSYLTNEEAIADAYRATDFVLLPSLEDNFPNIITEAAACGATLLGVPCTGPGEIIPELGVGAVASELSAAAYAALLKSALKDAANWRERARGSSDRIAREFGETAVARDFLSLYEECGRAAAGSTSLAVKPTAADTGSAALALAGSFLKWAADHLPEAALEDSPVPEFDVLERTLLALREQPRGPLRHSPAGASLVVARLTNLGTVCPGNEIRVSVSNPTEMAVSAQLALGDAKGNDRIVLPGQDAILSLAIGTSPTSAEAQELLLLLRTASDYGLVAKPLAVHEITVFGTVETAAIDRSAAITKTRRQEPDRRISLAIRSNFYPAERYYRLTASWLGPERETPVMLHKDPGGSALILLHLVEKSFPDAYQDVTVRVGTEVSHKPIDVFPMEIGQVVAYEWVSDDGVPMRGFSISSPRVLREREAPDARSLGVMAHNVAVLPHRAAGGISVLRPGTDLKRLGWSDRETIGCMVRLTDDGYVYFEAEGLVLATGRLAWSLATDLISPEQFDLDAGCWLARFAKPTPHSYAVRSTENALEIRGAHDFANTVCFRGWSFRLSEAVRPRSRAEAMMRRRVYLNVAAEPSN